MGIRRGDIKVTQVKCNSEYNSPDTCLQYHVGQTGTIKTFNFDATTEETHLASQSYSVCIRPEEGFCCIEYSACRGVTGSFTPTTNIAPAAAQVDSQCSEDYIVIDGGMGVCSRLPGAVNTRFCGGFLNNIASQTANAAVCDCQPPFVVGITFDAGADAGAADNSAYTCASSTGRSSAPEGASSSDQQGIHSRKTWPWSEHALNKEQSISEQSIGI